MDADPTKVLPYHRTPAKSGWRAWVVAALSGIAAGSVISVSGYGVLCVGSLLGCAVGVVSATAATSHKFYFGLLGVSICIATLIGSAAIQNWKSNTLPEPRVIPILLFGTAAIVGLPGIIASIVASQPPRRK